MTALTLAGLTPVAFAAPAAPVVSAAGGPTATAQAQAALTRAGQLLGGTEADPGRGGQAAHGVDPGSARGDATLALRDLARLRGSLPPSQQDAAARILARPTDGSRDRFGNGYDTAEQTPLCSDVVCVHYVLKAGDKDSVSTTDADHDGVPDFAQTALAAFTHVDRTYEAAGYRAPDADGGRGGNNLPDVYLADIGHQGLYGYCTSDQAGSPAHTWAYCVVDNDFSKGEFRTHTPVQNLQVTAAHEYFHAVQFGYSYNADAWFMEATATWAEDELYTTINDNRQYLRNSPITLPGKSMDQFENRGTFHYGVWIFFRYLTERYPSAQGGMPTLVRDLWRRADATAGGRDEYSMQAIAAVLKTHHLGVTDAFAHFARANRNPGRAYDEGKAYPKAPLLRTVRVSPSSTRPKAVVTTLDHLTSATVRYQPSADLRGPRRLRLTIDLPPTRRGSEALITVQPRGAAPRVLRAHLDAGGNGSLGVDFTRAKVSWVEVTLVDAGVHYRCGRGTRFSCGGTPLDDGLTARLGAQVTAG